MRKVMSMKILFLEGSIHMCSRLECILHFCKDHPCFRWIILLLAFTALYKRLRSLVDKNMEVEFVYVPVPAHLTWHEFLYYVTNFHDIIKSYFEVYIIYYSDNINTYDNNDDNQKSLISTQPMMLRKKNRICDLFKSIVFKNFFDSIRSYWHIH